MRTIFFLVIIGIVYFFIKKIFNGLFPRRPAADFESRGAKKHVEINKEDIVEAEFEEIEEKDKTE